MNVNTTQGHDQLKGQDPLILHRRFVRYFL